MKKQLLLRWYQLQKFWNKEDPKLRKNLLRKLVKEEELSLKEAQMLGGANKANLNLPFKYIIRGDQFLGHKDYSDVAKNVSPICPNAIWVGDFTCMEFYGKFIYLATVIDRYTREVVGWSIGTHHSAQLVIDALEHAAGKREASIVFHSDQGSEYDSEEFISFVKIIGSKISMSEKASPWQNGYQESFFGKFKDEIGDLNRFETVGELIEAIYQQIHYYNYDRIHTKLKMPPAVYAELVRE